MEENTLQLTAIGSNYLATLYSKSVCVCVSPSHHILKINENKKHVIILHKFNLKMYQEYLKLYTSNESYR